MTLTKEMTKIEKQAELLPCPFCNAGNPILTEIGAHKHTIVKFMPDYEGGAFVECGGCGVSMCGKDRDDVVTKWNTRAPTAREKELEALLQPFAQFGQALLALEEIGDIQKLNDNKVVAYVQAGGGTWMLNWKHFNEIILYLYK